MEVCFAGRPIYKKSGLVQEMKNLHGKIDWFSVSLLDPILIPDKTSYCKTSQSLEAVRLVSDRSEIWQATQHKCCQTTCQISKQCNNYNYHSHSFATSWHLMIRHLIGYWNRPWLKLISPSDAYMHQWTGSVLVLVMACCLFAAKPLPEEMLAYHQLDPQEQTLVKF